MRRTYGGISAEERVAGRRERLLDAGLELFGTQGFDATGVKELCREAGLTDRYLYESFRDREALFLAVFDRLTDDLFNDVANAVLAVPSEPEAQLRAAVGTFIRALADDPRKPRIIFADTGGEHMKQTLRRFSELVAATPCSRCRWWGRSSARSSSGSTASSSSSWTTSSTRSSSCTAAC
jgi:AcrR family transcriptional regulator